MPQQIVAAPLVTRGLSGFSAWREFVVDSFPWLDVDHGARDFRANVRFRTFDDGSLAAMHAAACRVTRSEQGVRRAAAGHLKVLWQRAGTMSVEQDTRSALLRAGSVAICDTGRPYRLHLSDDAKLVVLTLPYRAVFGWERVSQFVCGTELDDRTVWNAALAASLYLLDDACASDDAAASRVLDGVQTMLSASLHHAVSRRARAATPLQLASVQEHIERRLDDPELCPDALANALHVSRRTLYHLFAEQATTPGRFIRDVRLERVRAALVAEEFERKSILEIALDHGFADSASFSRTFKAAFGVTPSVWRAMGRG